MSHIDTEEITKFGNWLSSIYGMSVATHHGKIHKDYHGIMFNFSVNGKAMVNMIKYTKTSHLTFLSEIDVIKTSPVVDYLFTLWNQSEARSLPIAEKQVMAINHATTQLLSLSAPARWDIQPPTAYFMTRVKFPDEDDWGKLKQVFGYLKRTLHAIDLVGKFANLFLMVGGCGVCCPS